MNTLPLISVIMPARNAEQYIEAALRSLLREEGVRLDIIVVNDGSTDGTAAIVQSVAASDRAVRMVDGPATVVSMARNAGLSAVPAEAQYITFLDSDDLNVPGRIARQLRLLQDDTGAGFVMGKMQFFEKADESRCVPLPGSRTVSVLGVGLAAALFRKSVFEEIGMLDEDMHHGEDTDYFLRLLEARIPYLVEDCPAILYRRHDGNMTNDLARTRRGFADAIRRSLVRRRRSGAVVELGELFKARGVAEEMWK